MRYVIIHYCQVPDCTCIDCSGVIAYDGFDFDEAKHWLANAPAGYIAKNESSQYMGFCGSKKV